MELGGHWFWVAGIADARGPRLCGGILETGVSSTMQAIMRIVALRTEARAGTRARLFFDANFD
jgi:hypothetical protein